MIFAALVALLLLQDFSAPEHPIKNITHNHPSGNVVPSEEDREITGRLRQAGETLGIELLDHIIFTQHKYYSFLEHGEL